MLPLRPGLYAITPDEADTERLLAQVRPALAGGASVLQYRNKHATPELKQQQATALRALCADYHVPLIINDDLDLMLAVDADGLHLGREDAPAGGLAAARAALGPKRMLGVSCYNDFSRAQEAVQYGANYVAFGALFPSGTKPQAPRAPLALLGRARHELACLVVGIGGINLETGLLAKQAGADLIAVISDLFSADDIQARAQTYSQLYSQDRA